MTDYSKMPRWWRNANPDDAPKLCKAGKHVPVKAINPDGSYEIYCQNCTESMTEREYTTFFNGSRKNED